MIPVRTIIVDDEPLARAVVREYLGRHVDVEVIGECANGFEAVKVIVEERPDLVFLDIRMPRLDGFEVLDLLDEHPAVVFVTAYDDFAVRAFDVHAVDYLLKPVDPGRLDAALERVRERLRARRAMPLAPVLADARAAEQHLHRLLIRDRADVHVIPVDTIDYIEARDDYIAVRAGGKTYLKQERLSALTERLDPERFVRVHRSYLVNIDRLSRIELYARDSRILFLKDGTKLPLSRVGYRRLKDLL